jgi:hypothetical protein
MFVLAADDGKSWIDLVQTLGTIGAAGLSVWGAYLGTKKVRAKTTPHAARAGEAPDLTSGEELAPEVEGYIVRFIIFYLSVSAWNAVLTVTNPFLYGGHLVQLAEGAIYVMIFVLLGLPLLFDIARRYGMRGRKRPHRPRARKRRRTARA